MQEEDSKAANRSAEAPEQIVPDEESEQGKKGQVTKMFDSISPYYDFLNHFLSMGIDITWRKRLINKMNAHKPSSFLDVATGTGDLAIMAARNKKHQPEKIIGVDISEGMLEIGRKKLKKRSLSDKVTLEWADSENLSFDNNTFDAVSVAFGVRNFENLKTGLDELYRVTKPGGYVYILEFSQPQTFPFKQVYNFYFKQILPLVGRTISKHKKAYSYLPESVSAFPSGPAFATMLKEAGFKDVICENLTLGISTLYIASK